MTYKEWFEQMEDIFRTNPHTHDHPFIGPDPTEITFYPHGKTVSYGGNNE